MILRIVAAALIATAASAGCARLDRPEPATAGWSQQRIAAESEDGVRRGPPVHVPERLLEPRTLGSMTKAELMLLYYGAQVRETAASVADPEETAEVYAARQRARATPPE